MIDECRYEGNIEHQWGNISAFEMVHRFWSVMLLGGYCTHGETYHRDDEVLWWSKGGELHGESVKRIAFLKDIMYELEGQIEPEDKYNINPDSMNSTAELGAMQNNPYAKYVKLIKSLDPAELDDFISSLTSYSGRYNDKYIIQYFGRECRAFCDIMLPENGGEYSIDVIDIWEMTRETVIEKAKGKTRVPLPGKEGIVVLAKLVN